MILRGAVPVGSDDTPRDINAGRDDRVLVFEEAIVFPGLINSHDHLEFDLYPQLAHGPYRDYVEWGDDIHGRDREIIAGIESVPRALRFEWGVLKNLIAGVTAVANHGASRVESATAPIALISRGTDIHSVQLGTHWRLRINAPRNAGPYVFHIGEGTSPQMHDEVKRLLRWNLLRRELIGVHAIAMDESQAAHFLAIVWCPVSNELLFRRTASIERLKRSTSVVFGTDSTLSSDWNIWAHLRRARETKKMDDRELFESVTLAPRALWRLDDESAWVVARRKARSLWDAFYAVDPEDVLLVVRRGQPIVLDPAVTGEEARGLYPVRIQGRAKMIALDAAPLLSQLRSRGSKSNLPVET
jgi:cytosine/adenosine deaminase-related metal-dependent hydrolase